jgi:beta-glucanase (GH16 family)
MKKISLVVSMFIALLLSSACQQVVGEKPVFGNAGNLVGVVNEDADLYFNIVATDIEDGDITENVVITNSDTLPLSNGKYNEIGEFVIKYSVSDSDGNSTIYNRLLIVNEENNSIKSSTCNEEIDGYVITFCDDFTEAVSPNEFGVDMTKWGYQNGDGTEYGIPGWGNNEAQYYREENSFVENGSLFIEAKLEAYGGKTYTSSKLVTNTKFSQTYGRFEARIKLPVGNGLWPAFWMMPEESVYGGWARSGEIDIMEAKGRFPFESSGAIHYGGTWPNNTYQHGSYTFDQNNGIDQFHVYAVEWTSESITWYVDNDVMWSTSNWYSEGNDFPAPFDQDFFIILNLAIGGNFDGGILPSDQLFDSNVYMEIDYVRVLQYTN